MRLSFAGGVIVAAVLVALVIAYSTLFTVHQTRQAIVVRLGQPVDVVTDPGLNYKYPLIEP
jgi:membrane protease subunit HflC